MRGLRSLTLALCVATPLAAQDTSEDDKSYIESWLQDALSEAGRDVTVTGFKGALSSNATLDKLTIADDDGVWFTMQDASLEWSRKALFSGRLEISEITIGTVTVSRLPNTEGNIAPEDAEAWEFALPELPVSIDIDDISADTILLDTPVLGEAATLSLAGDFLLDAGAADATLSIRRKERNDQLTFETAFSNETRNLQVDFDFSEERGGIVATALRIPGTPALRLQVNGDAPLSDFLANVALTSDGARRFGGAVKISAIEQGALTGHAFSADLSGDVRPLFQPELHPFMGERSALELSGQSLSDGRVTLDRLRMASGVMLTEGSLALAPDGWPERFELQGVIQNESRTPVRLPLAGPVTQLQDATYTTSYDAAKGDTWTAQIAVTDFARDQIRIEKVNLAANGTIDRATAQSVSANIAFDVDGLNHDNPDLARAIGPSPSGTTSLLWKADNPLEVQFLSLKSGDMSLTASGRIGELKTGFPLTGRATLRSADLTRFAGLAGHEIAGATNADIRGTGKLIGGAFDIELDARTQDLRIGLAQIDGVLNGQSTLSLAARRESSGTVLDRLAIRTPVLTATASGRVNRDSGELTLDAEMTEIASIDPRLSGPAQVDTVLRWTQGQPLELVRLKAAAASATLSATGTLDPENPALPAAGQLDLSSQDLSQLSGLTGRNLSGQIELSLSGKGDLRGKAFDITAALDGTGVRSGLAELDRLIAGDITFETSLAAGAGPPDLRYLKLASPRLRANASGTGPGAPVAISARITDVAVLAPGFDGPAAARGTITIQDQLGQVLGLSLDVSGTAGTSATVTGEMRDYGKTLALSIIGNAPLGLVNRFLTPRSIEGPANFNLRLDGPPKVTSLSGQITTSNARLTLPTLNSALSGLTGTATLASGQANVDVRGTAGSGGSFRIIGPVTLTPPFNAALEATLSSLGATDFVLYTTTINGVVSVTGPLTGGANIAGALSLGPTELRVPSGGGTTLGAIKDIRHVNEPAAVAATRRRAGLIKAPGRTMVAYPINLTISAPNRIFVRGRGLDAELGGQLVLRGTTADVQPSGVFELIRGRLDILGRRLELTQGLIDLRGALDPYLRFAAETTVDDTLVSVILEGRASEPTVTFSSIPELPQDEVVARLLFGRGMNNISPFQAAQLVAAAATLSGKRSGGLIGGLRGAFGLGDLDVSSTSEGATQFRAGAYISENIYTDITADDEGNQEINLNLDISPSFKVKGRTNSEGETGIGIFFERDY